ncbi:hypothetical protein OH710_25595, partial [Pseudomonas capsici]|nr:hypothetical protein [Pseudomonas capsici]
MFRLRNADLADVLAILNDLEKQLCQKPKSWQEYLGEIQHPRQEKRPIKPLLFRSRAVRIVQILVQAFASFFSGRDKTHPLIKRKDPAEWQFLTALCRSRRAAVGPGRVKTQQAMAINWRGIFSVPRRP